jgi:hypothetical protein
MSEIDRLHSEMLEKDVQGMKANLRANGRIYNFGRLSWQMISETDAAALQKISQEGCRRSGDPRARGIARSRRSSRRGNSSDCVSAAARDSDAGDGPRKAGAAPRGMLQRAK